MVVRNRYLLKPGSGSTRRRYEVPHEASLVGNASPNCLSVFSTGQRRQPGKERVKTTEASFWSGHPGLMEDIYVGPLAMQSFGGQAAGDSARHKLWNAAPKYKQFGFAAYGFAGLALVKGGSSNHSRKESSPRNTIYREIWRRHQLCKYKSS